MVKALIDSPQRGKHRFLIDDNISPTCISHKERGWMGVVRFQNWHLSIFPLKLKVNNVGEDVKHPKAVAYSICNTYENI